MFKFKKDKVLLLKTLRDLVKESMSVNPLLEEEAAEFLSDLTESRNVRRLKKLNEALDEWIKEMISEQKLRKEAQLFDEAKRKEYEKHIANRD